MMDWKSLFPPEPNSDADYASLRTPGRIYFGKPFVLKVGRNSEKGSTARYSWQVIYEAKQNQNTPTEAEEIEVEIHRSAKGRVQIRAKIVRDQGNVTEIKFDKITGNPGNAKSENILNLDKESSDRLINMFLTLRETSPENSDEPAIDNELLSSAMSLPQAAQVAYKIDPEKFRLLIENDISAEDVVAVAARKKKLEEFDKLLNNPEEFEIKRQGGSRESVWQRFFEENPWILGVGLSSQLFTAWDDEKLEKTVAGASVGGPGKRVDAMLTTSGIVRSLVLAEIKLHDDPLLEKIEYRSGCWAPSREVTGGVAQAHITAERAKEDIGNWLETRDTEGFPTGERIYTGTPRSYLVIGQLSSLTKNGAPHPEKVKSFELYRHNLSHPEVITYDEVLARAQWSLEQVEMNSKTD
ncbi:MULTISPECIES: Shedu immune nuclease family protein [Nocardiopsis]|uniref:Shedu immune nuclease family protein n=1 Tax=Nocardiopsis lambiniae TaxID=3075539 RepID=A0ABU2MD76_9ACTN|nr:MULTISPECIES: Shedu immune nuclease family protein [unclassified Nocardiopsis]MDE3720373.1 DUF4263 domain-containing protein [Nocardiopsis sp. N85]MDT0330538.1 Shedu immune nuclease family protein [Nocardiopsis sp. DSM 44743]